MDSDIEQILKDDHGDSEDDQFDIEAILKEDDDEHDFRSNNKTNSGQKRLVTAVSVPIEPTSQSKQVLY